MVNVVSAKRGSDDAWPVRLLPVKLAVLLDIAHDATPAESQKTLVRPPDWTEGGTAQISACAAPRYFGGGGGPGGAVVVGCVCF